MSIPENGRRRRKDSVINIGSVRPFAMFAEKYLEAGWHPLILPAGKKHPPPVGYTGRYDKNADERKLAAWPEERDRSGNLVYDERANLAFRAPLGVLGIDVDDYAGKPSGNNGAVAGKLKVAKPRKMGGTSLSGLEQELGKLPDTWISTARTDGVSGIRWYRVPEELVWPGKLGVDIESVWYRYRFAVAPPSIHPELGLPYLWYAPGTYGMGMRGTSAGSASTIPDPLSLPDLPEAWVDGLQKGIWAEKGYDLDSSRRDLRNWILARPEGQRSDSDESGFLSGCCPLMRKAAQDAVDELQGAGSAHETLNQKLYYLLRLAAEGHAGIKGALQEIRPVFLAEVMDRSRAGSARSEKEAVEEYERSRDGAVREILGQLKNEARDLGVKKIELPDECSCYIPKIDRPRGVAGDPNSYGRTELDNAYFIRDLHFENLRWLPKEGRNGEWTIWDEDAGAWYKSGSKFGPSIGRLAQVAAEERAEAAAHVLDVARKEAEKAAQQEGAEADSAIEKAVKADADYKHAAALFEWATKCKSNANKIATINQLKDLPELTGDIADFDADPFLLQFPNGVLDLNDVDAGLRAVSRSDFMLRRMRFEYIEDALNLEWEEFLASSIPNAKVRDYVHRLAGYTLLGRNTEKKAVFLIGESNSGKSVFNDVMRKTFGSYGHTFDLTLMKSKREAGPRSDLLNAVPVRYLAANESSDRSSLHADELKRLTGGDEIAATAKYSNEEINVTPAFTPWISSQEVPHIKVDKAIKNRVEPIVFPNEFVPITYPEGGLSDHLLAVAGPAITAWLVDGLRKYNERALRGRPLSIDKASDEFALDAAGHLGEFVRECLEKADKDTYVLTEDITKVYDAWCFSNDITPNNGKIRSTLLGKSIGKLIESRADKEWIPEKGTTKAVRYGVSLSKKIEDI